jgi:hypothetical protein
MEDSKQECVGLDMPNGISKEIRYDQRFVRPSAETMPKHQRNHAAMKAPSLSEVMKGIDRK